MDKEKLKSVAGKVITSLGALILGAVFSSWYNAARPRVDVVDVGTSLAYNLRFIKKNTQVIVPPDLRDMALRSDWSDPANFRRPTAEYQDFIDSLDENEHRMQDFLESADSLRKDLPSLRSALDKCDAIGADEKNDFFDLWERNDGFIYGSIRGDHGRGTFDVSPRSYKHPPIFILSAELLKSGDQLWIVKKRGGKFASFLAPERASEFPFQKNVSEALANFDCPTLIRMLEAAKQDTSPDEEKNTKDMIEQLKMARRNLSRWSVTVTISNRGGTPITFSPFAVLRVDTSQLNIDSGKPYGQVTEVLLEHRSPDSDLQPIFVDKQSAQLVTMVSADFVRDIGPPTILVRAYDLGGVQGWVELSTAGGDYFSNSNYQTKRFSFSSSKYALGKIPNTKGN